MRMWHVVHAGQQRPEHLAVGDDAANRNAAEVYTVIAAFPADEAETAAVTLGPVIGNGDLERGVDAFRSRIGVEDVVHAFRRDIDQPVCQFEGLGVTHLEGRSVVEFGCLFLDGLSDQRAAVARVDAPESGRAIKHLAAFCRLEMHVLCRDEHARVLLELAVCRERHPEGTQIVRGCIQPVRHREISIYSITPARAAV